MGLDNDKRETQSQVHYTVQWVVPDNSVVIDPRLRVVQDFLTIM